MDIYHDSSSVRLNNYSVVKAFPNKEILWTDVTTVVAYKRDAYIVDLICLGIAINDGTVVEVDEEMNGWNALIEHLPQYLLGCKPKERWWSEVAFPPFVDNVTIIYQSQNK